MKKIKGEQGFTLIELMIVVAIITILSAIGYPAYMNNVYKTNRSDALDVIADTANRLERCMTTYGSYNNASCTGVANGTNIASKRDLYSLAVTSTAATYSLTVTPKSGSVQQKDTKCTSFTLTNAGVKSSLPSGSKCW